MNNKRCYAGIGSRACPNEVLEAIVKVASWLGRKGYTLRSGGANGCDLTFEKGCDFVKGKKEIFLPWKNFNNSTSKLVVNNKKATEIARKYHPYYESLKQGAKKLQDRNSCQVLGYDLDSPSDFIICYTPGGKGSGGTGQALRIAKDFNIPIFDFGNFETIDEARTAFLLFFNEIDSKTNE